MPPTVIVFGPTGNVGSVAALTAHSLGAKVILGMRDPSKAIPGLSTTQEQEGGYKRVQADLTKPESLASAVRSSGATRAFVYLAHGNADHMKASLQALKSAGVEFVVFLSSYTISIFAGDAKDVPHSEIIPYVHARVELNLDEVFGPENYVAVRPGGFATNLLRYKHGIASGEVRLFGSDFKMDCITPADMGAASGTILATQSGPKQGQEKVLLYGPQIVTIGGAIGVIARVLGKEVKIVPIDKSEAMQQFAANKIPKPMAEYMVRGLEDPLNEKKRTATLRRGSC